MKTGKLLIKKGVCLHSPLNHAGYLNVYKHLWLNVDKHLNIDKHL